MDLNENLTDKELQTIIEIFSQKKQRNQKYTTSKKHCFSS